MESLNLTKSFFYSIGIHIILLLFFGFWITFQRPVIPMKTIVVDFQADMTDLPEIKHGEAKSSDQSVNVNEKAKPETAKNNPKAAELPKETPKSVEGTKPDQNPLPAVDQAALKQKEQKDKLNQELNRISGNIDQALDEGDKSGQGNKAGMQAGGATKGDPLSDANWSSRPRKTLSYPDIQSKIPESYKKKGMSYSVTARMTFDKNGLAIKIEIISSSGDAVIDNIFSTELRKIRVEPSASDRTVEAVQTFPIILK